MDLCHKCPNENKTVSFRGSGMLEEEDDPRSKQHLEKCSATPCSQCVALIIPLLPGGFYSDILVNIFRSKRTSLAGEGQTHSCKDRKENSAWKLKLRLLYLL